MAALPTYRSSPAPEPLRIAIIGSGRRANYHLRNLLSLRDVQIVALCDTEPENAHRLCEVYERLAEAHVYSDHHTLLAGENLDGVVINTPHATHFPIAVACLEHGLHVLVEKPVACSVAEAWQLRDRVRESGRLLIVAYQRRYDSAYRYVRQTIAEGCLGRLVAVNGYQTQSWKTRVSGTWRQRPELSGGGQLIDSGSHFLDVVLWATQLAPRSVFALVDNAGTPVDIRSTLLIEFAGGVQGALSVVGDGAGWSESLTFMGEAATLTYRDGHLTILSPDSEEMEIGPLPPASNPDENFVRAIQGREEPACSIEDGLRVLELTEAAWESAREARPRLF